MERRLVYKLYCQETIDNFAVPFIRSLQCNNYNIKNIILSLSVQDIILNA